MYRVAVCVSMMLLCGCGEPSARELIRRSQPDSGLEIEVRRDALIALGSEAATSKPAMDALFARLEDENSALRIAAVVALGAAGVDLLAAANDEETAPQSVAVIVERLIAALGDPELSVRIAAVRTLGRIGPAAAEGLPVLLRVDDAHLKRVRPELLSAIVNVGDDRAVEQLTAGVQNEPPAVRALALEALGRLGVAAEPAVDEIATALVDPSLEVRTTAAEAAMRLGPTVAGAMETVVKATSHANPEIRATAADVLGRIGPAARPATGELVVLLDDPQWHVRAAAADALSQVGIESESVVSALTARLADGDEHWFVRSAVAGALGNAGRVGQVAVPMLIEALRDEERMVRVRAADALNAIDPDAAATAGVMPTSVGF